MKKVFSIFLSLMMVLALCTVAFAAGEDPSAPLQFNPDGTFKILQVNDTQDIDKMNKKTVAFLKKALETEQPDLVVVAGDILSDMFIGATETRIKNAIRALGTIFNDAKVPFAITFGNHDHDLEDTVSIADMMKTFEEFDYCVNSEGCDPGTYSLPILNSDGTAYALNVYMMDTNNKNGTVSGYTGVYPNQVEWYKEKSDELKAANGGKVIPSLLFQHVPVKEIYQFIDETSAKESNTSVFSLDNYKWYRLNSEKLISDNSVLGEAPCSEPLTHVTGQYEAWLEKGDIIGAFFAHDHVNNFVGRTDEGLILGYNGGTGFRSYGNGGKRSVRVFELNENNVSAYTTRSVFYEDLIGDPGLCVSDLLTPAIVGDLLRTLYRFLGITNWY